MSGANVNLQDSILNQVRKEGVQVEVMLVSGATFQGQVKGFDNFTVVMSVDGKQHLIYKHAIAQLVAPRLSARPHPEPPAEVSAEAAGDNGAPRARTQEKGARRPGPRARRREPADQPKSPSADQAPPERFNALDLSAVRAQFEKASQDAT